MITGYLGKLVGLTNGHQVIFGPLQQVQEDVFAVRGNGFQTGMIKEMTPIEVDPSINEARLIIKV
jgi:hypothetical protein